MHILSKRIPRNGNFPNNPHLPLLLYKEAVDLKGHKDPQVAITLFRKNHWKNSWINGIYPFHHYHSNTHEVLGICSGTCHAQFGGEDGLELDIEIGDVLIIPAGVSHKNLKCTDDFVCVGAYPLKTQYDMNYGEPDEMHITEENIKQVPLPECDPVFGTTGPLFDFWK